MQCSCYWRTMKTLFFPSFIVRNLSIWLVQYCIWPFIIFALIRPYNRLHAALPVLYMPWFLRTSWGTLVIYFYLCSHLIWNVLHIWCVTYIERIKTRQNASLPLNCLWSCYCKGICNKKPFWFTSFISENALISISLINPNDIGEKYKIQKHFIMLYCEQSSCMSKLRADFWQRRLGTSSTTQNVPGVIGVSGTLWPVACAGVIAIFTA